MATLGSTRPTLTDVASRLDPKGQIDKVAEILNEQNDILTDIVMIEGNLPDGHKTTMRSGIPEPTWRLINQGVQPKKSRTVQVTDKIGMLEARSEIDKELADMNGNSASFRLSEDAAFLEGMNQEMMSTLFYGNILTHPARYHGLSARYNDPTAANGVNLINGGGTGSDNTSIWLICWGPNTVHGIYPKGSKAGLTFKDLGEMDIDDEQGYPFRGYSSLYQWKMGISLRDWRYCVRICNIDVSALTKDATAGADLIDLMTDAIECLPSETLGRPVFYCNKTIRTYLRKQIRNAKNVNITMEEVAGKKVVAFDGIPVRRCDALLSTESAITFA